MTTASTRPMVHEAERRQWRLRSQKGLQAIYMRLRQRQSCLSMREVIFTDVYNGTATY